MAGGPQYRKLLKQDLQQNGVLPTGEVRQFKGTYTNVLWIYTVNLPEIALGKNQCPSIVYKALMNALEKAAQANLSKVTNLTNRFGIFRIWTI